jgi:prepilin-type N-terminal cleavage/methylation domain-containing protein
MMDETRSSEHGFTLIELLIAMMVSGLILAAASTGFITTARGMVDLHDRFVQSHDAQLLAAYFPSDVQSANPNLGVDTNPGAWAICAGSAPADDNVLQLQWVETTGAVATPFAVSYRTREVPRPSPAPADWQLVRYYCSGTTVHSDVVAHNLAQQVGTTAPPLPKVDPTPFTGRKLTLTLFSAPATAGPYSYTFSGQMRTPIPPPPYPVVSFINLKTPTPTNAPATLAWKVVFDRAVAGVDSDDFDIDFTGLSGVVMPPTVAAVSPTEYTVTIDPGPGSGAIGLSLVDDNSIRDTTAAQNELGGSAPEDGNHPGPSYIIDRLAPVASSIVLAGDQSTSGPNVSWTVTFSEDVRFVDAADFTLVPGAGVSGGSITLTPVSAAVYTVAAGPVGGSGTLGLNLTDNNTIKDDAGNPLGGPSAGDGNFTGPTYDISAAAPAAPSITNVQLVNKAGGTPGKIEMGDSVVIKFSAIMKVSSFCPIWAGDGNDQSRATGGDVTVTVTNAGTTGSNDVLQVTSAGCTPFNFGSIDLAGDYVGTNAFAFAGSGTGTGNTPSEIDWDATAHTLTVTLGKASGGTPAKPAVLSSSPVYSASTNATDPYGQSVDNSPFTLPAGAQF